MADVLEHKILAILYNLGGYTISDSSLVFGHIPIYKKTYEHSTIHFGTLVDALNNPNNYTGDKKPDGEILYWQNLIKTTEEINIDKFSFEKVADAIEVLLANDHIKEQMPKVAGNDLHSREIILLKDGAIALKSNFYLKKSEASEIEEIKNTTTRIELSLKKNWLRNEIIKYSITTLLGALIALIASQWGDKSKEQLNKQLQITGDTIIVKSTAPKN